MPPQPGKRKHFISLKILLISWLWDGSAGKSVCCISMRTWARIPESMCELEAERAKHLQFQHSFRETGSRSRRILEACGSARLVYEPEKRQRQLQRTNAYVSDLHLYAVTRVYPKLTHMSTHISIHSAHPCVLLASE